MVFGVVAIIAPVHRSTTIECGWVLVANGTVTVIGADAVTGDEVQIWTSVYPAVLTETCEV